MALNHYLLLQKKWDQIFSFEYDLRTRVVKEQWNGSSGERCHNYVNVTKLVAENVPVCCIFTICSGIIKIALMPFVHTNYQAPEVSMQQPCFGKKWVWYCAQGVSTDSSEPKTAYLIY